MQGSDQALFEDSEASLLSKYLHLPIKHTVRFPLIDIFLQVKKKNVRSQRDVSKKAKGMSTFAFGSQSGEVRRQRLFCPIWDATIPCWPLSMLTVPDPLRQPKLDYPIWYLILKSCKHIILHTCFFQSSKTVCLYSSISMQKCIFYSSST